MAHASRPTPAFSHFSKSWVMQGHSTAWHSIAPAQHSMACCRTSTAQRSMAQHAQHSTADNLEGLLFTLMPLLFHLLTDGVGILVQLLIHVALAWPLPLCQLLQAPTAESKSLLDPSTYLFRCRIENYVGCASFCHHSRRKRGLWVPFKWRRN